MGPMMTFMVEKKCKHIYDVINYRWELIDYVEVGLRIWLGDKNNKLSSTLIIIVAE